MKVTMDVLGKIKDVVQNFLALVESPLESKKKWDELSKENARYYIYSDLGEKITEKEFRESGKRDVDDLIVNDAFLMKRLEPTEDKVAVEIGCGIGRLSEFIAPLFNELYAVDISKEMISGAKKRIHARNAFFFSTDGTNLPIISESADFVFSFIVFQHMPTTEVVVGNFEEIFRVLKPGGIAKIQVRGVPVRKGKWFTGVSFTEQRIKSVIGNLQILKTEGVGEKYFWLWLQKLS